MLGMLPPIDTEKLPQTRAQRHYECYLAGKYPTSRDAHHFAVRKLKKNWVPAAGIALFVVIIQWILTSIIMPSLFEGSVIVPSMMTLTSYLVAILIFYIYYHLEAFPVLQRRRARNAEGILLDLVKDRRPGDLLDLGDDQNQLRKLIGLLAEDQFIPIETDLVHVYAKAREIVQQLLGGPRIKSAFGYGTDVFPDRPGAGIRQTPSIYDLSNQNVLNTLTINEVTKNYYTNYMRLLERVGLTQELIKFALSARHSAVFALQAEYDAWIARLEKLDACHRDLQSEHLGLSTFRTMIEMKDQRIEPLEWKHPDD